MTISVDQTHNLLKLMEVCTLQLVVRYHNSNGWWLNHCNRDADDTEVTLLTITYQEKGKTRKYLYDVEYWRHTEVSEQGEGERELEHRETASGDNIEFIIRFLERNGLLLREEATQERVQDCIGNQR